MTNAEFSDQFDTLLNTYGNQAPFGEGTSIIDVTVDEYEKSVFLTKAQKELVYSLYSGNNQSGAAFEEKEQLREALDYLVKTSTPDPLSEVPESLQHLVKKGKNFAFYPIPENLLYIIFEEVKFSSYISGCDADTEALVVPSTHDEVWRRLNNPFRGPFGKRVLRLNASDNIVELIADHPIGSYLLRYVEEPTPIILTDLPDGLSIDGETKETECAAPESLHSEILDAAVRIALRSKSIGRAVPKEGK